MAAAAALRSKITRLESHIFKAKHHLQRLQLQLKAEIANLILTLPPEITSEIFLQCLPTDWETENVDLMLPEECPLLLTQVCSRWREVALSTPALWSTISVDVRRPHASKVLETWASRARGRQLYIGLWDGRGKGDVRVSLDVLRKVIRRVRYLRLQLDGKDLAQLDALVVDGDFPSLEEVAVDYDGRFHPGPPLSMFNHATALRAFRFLDGTRASSGLILPWEQLTEFTIDCLELAEFLRVLGCSPNITRCNVTLSSGERDRVPKTPFLHPNIQHLVVFEVPSDMIMDYDRDEGFGYAHVLEFLTLPALKTLELGSCDDLDPNILHAFLQRSVPPLQKLVFTPWTGQQLESMHPFHKLAITDLEITHPTRTCASDFFRALGTDPDLLPQLRNLSLRCHYHAADKADLALLVERAGAVISSRNNLECLNLRSLRIVSDFSPKTTNFNFAMENLRVLRALQKTGMDIYIAFEDWQSYRGTKKHALLTWWKS